ncbi:MAG: hypothetical protein QGF20_12145, partial [Alphaproteobacteria bacterium]|nr:hypothetical protein [Alphaproteobacteria bacterium]
MTEPHPMRRVPALAILGLAAALVTLFFAGFAAQAADAVAAGPYPPAPKLTAADYPTIAGVNGRIAVWIFAQLHLWFAAFVLAVPIFVFIIEVIGMRTRDKRYDDMAYEFIKVA